MVPDPRLVRLLGGPGTAWLVARARRRLERGQPLSGTVSHARPSPEERDALARLLGRTPRDGAALTVRWEAVDEVLRRSGAHPAGLADAVVTLGGPVRDRAAEAAADRAAWHRALAPLTAIQDRAELADWAEGLRRTGLVRRLAPTPEAAERLVADVVTVLGELPAGDEPVGRFAERVLGDAHALDADRPLSTLVFGVARRLGGSPEGAGSTWRREVWAAVGLLTDDLSSTVLTLGLPGGLATPTGRALGQLSAAGQPAVLTLRQLTTDRRWSGALDGVTVSVCENPVVVSLAADRLGGRSTPLVCVNGQPGAAALRLLRDLAEAGAALRYHGDFDWGGIRIANLLFDRLPLMPWRFDAAAFRQVAHAGGRPLAGTPVQCRWDPALAPALSAHGRAVEEERVADRLIDDLDVHPARR